MKSVSVIPAAAGWVVRSDAIQNELFFTTGAAAERAGRRLAEGLAQAGEAVSLSIYLRDGTAAANFLLSPPPRPASTEFLPAWSDSGAASPRQDSVP